MADGDGFPLSVAESELRGRDCVSTRAIAAGETVLRVAPLAAVPTDGSISHGLYRV
jgi:hypothetical protein